MVSLAALAEPTRLKRGAIALVAIVLVVLGALAVRATIAVEEARGEVESHLSAILGRPLRLTGTPTSQLLPWPRVHFDDVAVTPAEGGPPLARMDTLDVSLDVAALLLGRLRPDEIRLARPEIRLAGAEPRLTVAAVAALMTAWKPTIVVIEKGRLVAARPDGDEVFDSVDLRLSWPRPSANADLRAAFRWRGEAVAVEAETPSPTRFTSGGSGPLIFRLTSRSLHLALSGVGGPTAETPFTGTGEIELADAARFARWIGWPRDPDLLAGRLRLDARLTADAQGATLSDLRVDLAGNKGGGALTWRWDLARPRLGGTIAFTEVDLATERRRPYGAGWRAFALDRAASGPDIDLRLSTPTLRMPKLTLQRVAAALHVAEGRLHAEIGSAELFGRPVSLVLRGTLDGDGLKAQIRGSGDDLPLLDGAALFDIAGIESGRASVAIEAETRCRELGACLGAFDGRVTVSGRAVTVTGASPFAGVSRFHPIVPQPSGATITTTWDRTDLDLRIAGTRADVDRVEILGQSARYLFAGRGDLVSGAVDLTGYAYFPAFRPDPARSGSTETAVPLRIGGTVRRLEATARDVPAAVGETPAPTAAP